MKKNKTAIILTGGGGSAAFEVGVLKGLLKIIEPDFFITTSMGSVNAAYLLSYQDQNQGIAALERLWLNYIKNKKFFKFKINSLIFPKLHKSILSEKRFVSSIKKIFKSKRFEELKIPLYIGAMNLDKNEMEFFNKGILALPIIASSSITPLFPPFKIKGCNYIDGGFDIDALINKAITLGAKNIIIINKSAVSTEYSNNFIDTALRSIEYIFEKSIKLSIEMNKNINIIRIRPKKQIMNNFFSLKNTRQLIRSGEESLVNNISLIKNIS